MALSILLLLGSASLVLGQRPFFAGSRPIGFPEVTTDRLADRFGEVDGTTQRLPIDANGDRDLVDRLSKLPIDKQPFWFINWQALEAHRQKPQTYPQKPNVFIDSNIPSSDSAIVNSNSETSTNSNSATSNPAINNVDSNSATSNSAINNVDSNSASNIVDKFGVPNSNESQSSTTVSSKVPAKENKKPYA